MRSTLCFPAVLIAFAAVAAIASAADRHVGPGKAYANLNDAYDAAEPGDTILVHFKPNNAPYRRVALQVRKANLTFRAVRDAEAPRIALDGAGFNYSGRGAIPRAIVQFNPDADGCSVVGFELRNASNRTHNGAGVRINQANDVTLVDCEIHHNDMGVMSNGTLAESTAANQRILDCHIHHNGAAEDPGYNHNLYLGGTSVMLRGCEIDHAATGHNVKSRAHLNWVEGCYVHGSANREFDLVQAKGNTDAPRSHALLIGNCIVKKPRMRGNKAVIHFGSEKRAIDHNGTLFLVHNTIVTPHRSPVVDLSAPGAGLSMMNNLVWDRGAQHRQTLVKLRHGAKAAKVAGRGNWFAAGFAWPDDAKIAPSVADRAATPAFADADASDHRVTGDGWPAVDRGAPWRTIKLPSFEAPARTSAVERMHRFAPPLGAAPRAVTDAPDPGAFEAGGGDE